MNKNKLAAAGVFLLMLALWWHSYYVQDQERRTGVTSYSESGKGVSAFRKFASQFISEDDLVLRQALLDKKLLSERDVLMINSPRRPLSSLEKDNAVAFMRAGGTVLLSFYKDEQGFMLDELIAESGLAAEVVNNDDYANGETQKRQPTKDGLLVRTQEVYEFYSPLSFKDDACTLRSIECFYREVKVGKGYLIVSLGLPLFGNSLIRRSDNSRFAARLLDLGGGLKIDEYHHFFPEKTVWDLLTEPRFILPVAAIASVTLLFFIFGYSRLYELGFERKPEFLPRSYHNFGSELIGERLRASDYAYDAAQFQADVMRQIYPKYSKDISALVPESGLDKGRASEISANKIIRDLIALHQRILKESGKV